MFDLFGNTDAAANKIIKDKTMRRSFPIIRPFDVKEC